MSLPPKGPGVRVPIRPQPTAWDELRQLALRKFSVELSREAIEKLQKFVRLVEDWSETTRLVSFRGEGELVFRHVLDSLALCPLLPPGNAWADIGSGAGFPGVPLAVVRAERGWLVESRRRRANFLRHVVCELGLEGVGVFHGRAEDFSHPILALTGRGIQPGVLLSLARKLLPIGGCVLLMLKASADPPEVAGFRQRSAIAYELPGQLKHKVVMLERCFT